jgi:hypothetical protein
MDCEETIAELKVDLQTLRERIRTLSKTDARPVVEKKAEDQVREQEKATARPEIHLPPVRVTETPAKHAPDLPAKEPVMPAPKQCESALAHSEARGAEPIPTTDLPRQEIKIVGFGLLTVVSAAAFVLAVSVRNSNNVDNVYVTCYILVDKYMEATWRLPLSGFIKQHRKN